MRLNLLPCAHCRACALAAIVSSGGISAGGRRFRNPRGVRVMPGLPAHTRLCGFSDTIRAQCARGCSAQPGHPGLTRLGLSAYWTFRRWRWILVCWSVPAGPSPRFCTEIVHYTGTVVLPLRLGSYGVVIHSQRLSSPLDYGDRAIIIGRVLKPYLTQSQQCFCPKTLAHSGNPFRRPSDSLSHVRLFAVRRKSFPTAIVEPLLAQGSVL